MSARKTEYLHGGTCPMCGWVVTFVVTPLPYDRAHCHIEHTCFGRAPRREGNA